MRDYYELTEQGRRNRLRPLAHAALEEYDIEPVRLRGLTEATNGVFRVDTADGQRYALRVGLGPPVGHPVEEVRSELEWLAALSAETEVRVPEPIPTRQGTSHAIASADGVPHDRVCVLFSWLEGTNLADRLTPPTVRAYGARMAQLHVHAAGFEPSPGFTTGRYDSVYPYATPFVVFEKAGPELLPPDRKALFEEATELVTSTIADLTRAEPARVLHGDLHVWNAMIDHGDVAVFDFEDLVWGWPVQDIGTAFYYLWGSEEFDRHWSDFRAGYESITPWPDPGGRVATFIAGRTLVMANDVITQPEWASEAAGVYERGERRIRDMLQRVAEGG